MHKQSTIMNDIQQSSIFSMPMVNGIGQESNQMIPWFIDVDGEEASIAEHHNEKQSRNVFRRFFKKNSSSSRTNILPNCIQDLFAEIIIPYLFQKNDTVDPLYSREEYIKVFSVKRFPSMPTDPNRRRHLKQMNRYLFEICYLIVKSTRNPRDTEPLDRDQFLEAFLADISDDHKHMTTDVKKQQEIVTSLVQKIKSQNTPRERRQLLSFFRCHYKRKELEYIFGIKISENEWVDLAIHNREYGVGEHVPMKQYVTRRYSEPVYRHFLECSSKYFQQVSFGYKNADLGNGKKFLMGAVKLTKSIEDIISEYHKVRFETCKIADDEASCNEERCRQESSRKGYRCRLKKDHSQLKCRYLPHDTIGYTEARNILQNVTAGSIKSLKGLDDIDTVKGHENFRHLKQITSKIGELGNLSPDKLNEVHALIDWVQTYHKTDFIQHLDDPHMAHICACVRCGFHDKEHDPIECKFRMNGTHLSPCEGCFKSCEELPDQIRALLVTVKDTLQNPSQRTLDDLLDIEFDINMCFDNLIAYRAHIVQKWSEETESTLDKETARIVADFMMKRLPLIFRENKIKFYGLKAHTSIHGSTLVRMVDDTPLIDFFMFLSADTTQDTKFVLTCADIMNRVVLPHYPEIKNVVYESDGAGCYSCPMSKTGVSFMMNNVWAKDIECEIKQVKQSVPGTGKDITDAGFGILRRCEYKAVNNGTDILSTEQEYDALEKDLPKGMHLFLIDIDRSGGDHDKAVIGDQLPGLKASLCVECSKDGIKHRPHSKYGEGISVKSEDIVCAWKKAFSCSCCKGKCNCDPLSPPKYTILKTTFSPPNQSSNFRSAIGHTESLQQRKYEIVKRVNKTCNLKSQMEEEQNQELQQITEGIFYCNAVDKYGNKCTRKYIKEDAYHKHILGDKHKFPSPTAEQIYVPIFHEMTASFCNRCYIDKTKHMHSLSRSGNPLGDNLKSYYDHGCYNKKRNETFEASYALRVQLYELFCEGDDRSKTGSTDRTKTGAQKHTPESALQSLRMSTVVDSNGQRRKKYGLWRGNVNGTLPSADWIKSHFSQIKSKAVKKPKWEADQFKFGIYYHLPRAIKEEFLTHYNLPVKNKDYLKKLLEFVLKITNKEGLEINSMKSSDIKAILKEYKEVTINTANGSGGCSDLAIILYLNHRILEEESGGGIEVGHLLEQILAQKQDNASVSVNHDQVPEYNEETSDSDESEQDDDDLADIIKDKAAYVNVYNDMLVNQNNRADDDSEDCDFFVDPNSESFDDSSCSDSDNNDEISSPSKLPDPSAHELKMPHGNHAHETTTQKFDLLSPFKTTRSKRKQISSARKGLYRKRGNQN